MNNVLNTKVNIFRNIKDCKFVPKLTDKQKQEIIEKVKSIYNENKEDIAINLLFGEHITIACYRDDFDLSGLNEAKELEQKLSSKLSMSYSDEFGYLMSDLNKVGAGIKLECDICLDAIKGIDKIDQVKNNVKKLGYNLIPTNNSSIYCLSTACNLGYSESEIVENFKKTVEYLQNLEVESAKMLDVGSHDELYDKTMRSLAILNSAYLMSPSELNEHLVNLRTGLNLNYVKINSSIINKLQKLAINQSEIISQSELKNLAEKVREILKGE